MLSYENERVSIVLKQTISHRNSKNKTKKYSIESLHNEEKKKYVHLYD